MPYRLQLLNQYVFLLNTKYITGNIKYTFASKNYFERYNSNYHGNESYGSNPKTQFQ